MAIYRGVGGASSTTSAANVEEVLEASVDAVAAAAAAKVSETNAAASAASAANTYDDFDDRYLGAKAADPSTDNDGDGLGEGALYFNTVSNEMKVYTGSAWAAFTDPVTTTESKTLTSGQTSVTFTNSTGFASFYVNGPDTDNGRLVAGVDYTNDSATNTITLTESYPDGTVILLTLFGALGEVAVQSSQVVYDQGDASAVNRTVESKLRDTVSVKDFGAVGDGVTDDTAAIQAAVNSGAVVYFPFRVYKLTSQIDVPSTCFKLLCNNSTFLVDHAGIDYPNKKAVFSGSHGWELHDGIFEAQNVNYTYYYGYSTTTGWSGSTSVVGGTEVYTLTTRNYLTGVVAGKGSVIRNNRFSNFFSGIEVFQATAPSPSDEKTIISSNTLISCGAGSSGVTPNIKVQYLGNVEVSGNRTHFGGESTFSSCKKLRITNNTFFNPTTPTIDVGGSGAVGFESEDVVISNNNTTGRDPIVCERGVFNLAIIGNVCEVTAAQPSGVGIGVTDQSDSNQGIRAVSITGNVITTYSTSSTYRIASGIKVGTDTGATSLAEQVVISGNTLGIDAFYGVFIFGNSTNKIKDARIDSNTITNSYRCINISDANNAVAANNLLSTSTYRGSDSSAYVISNVINTKLVNNDWRGTDGSTFGHDYMAKLYNTVTGTKFIGNDVTIPNGGRLFWRDGSASGDVYFDFDSSSFGATGGITDVLIGSKWTLVSPSGGYVGVVATTGGASPVFTLWGAHV